MSCPQRAMPNSQFTRIRARGVVGLAAPGLLSGHSFRLFIELRFRFFVLFFLLLLHALVLVLLAFVSHWIPPFSGFIHFLGVSNIGASTWLPLLVMNIGLILCLQIPPHNHAHRQ